MVAMISVFVAKLFPISLARRDRQRGRARMGSGAAPISHSSTAIVTSQAGPEFHRLRRYRPERTAPSRSRGEATSPHPFRYRRALH